MDHNIICRTVTNEDAQEMWSSIDRREDEITYMRELSTMLTSKDRSIYQTLYIDAKPQIVASNILGIPQPTIAQRVKSIQKAIRWLSELQYPSTSIIKRNLDYIEQKYSKNPTIRAVVGSAVQTPKYRVVAYLNGIAPAYVSMIMRDVLKDRGLDKEFVSYLKDLSNSPANIESVNKTQ